MDKTLLVVKINWKDLIKQVVYSNVTSNLYKKEEQTIVSQLNIIHFFSVVNGKPKQNELEGKIQTTDGEKKKIVGPLILSQKN